MSFDILIVDDERDIRELVAGILTDEGYLTRTASSCIEAMESINSRQPNLVLLDVWLGEGEKDGLRLLEVINKKHSEVAVIMMSGHGTIEMAVTAIKKGAYDFIEKPFDSNRLIVAVNKAVEVVKLRRENEELKIKARVDSNIIGTSQHVSTIKQTIEKISQVNGRCFISGPSGSDKESIAREIHRLSPRANNPFVTVNCRLNSVSQIDSDLFGMQIKNENNETFKVGLLEKANGGSIYLEDVDSLPLSIQSKLLKVLIEGKITRIGCNNQKIEVDVRFFAGSSADIKETIANGLFMDDLFCRLNANTINILPLSNRPEDIAPLIQNFVNQASAAYKMTAKRFSEDAVNMLTAYSWPGDVLQLRNVVDWILIMSAQKTQKSLIEVNDLPKEITYGSVLVSGNSEENCGAKTMTTLSIKDAREAFEREYLLAQLKRFSGNISQTSKFVGMERSALHRKLRSLNIYETKYNKCSNNK